MFRKIFKYISKYKLYTILCPLAVVCEVLLEIRIPRLMADIVDIGIATEDIGFVVEKGVYMILFGLAALLFGALSAFWGARAAVGFGCEVRRNLFNKVQEFSFANLDRFSTSSLIIRLTTDVTNIQNAFAFVVRILVRSPVMLVSATWMAYSINSQLVRVFLVAIPFMAFGMVIIAKTAFPRFTAMLTKYDNMNSSVQENLTAIRVVKSFVRAGYEKLKFKTSNEELMKAALRAEKAIIFATPLMMITMYSSIIAIIWFGGNMIVAGTMLTGELISFITYVSQVLTALMMISMVFIMLVLSRASLSRIVEVLDEKPEVNDDQAEEGLEVADGTIEFQDVSFSYYSGEADKYVLTKLNLRIEAGETVGIIGGTGSAKTTLVQLIPRLYDATEGRVLVGGRDVREYKLAALRNSVSMVLQKNVLFSGTIEENLRWGNPGATEEQVVQAALSACADDFVRAFPDGYQMELGQGGVNVSGGQKQRLAIARALLREPKIIILDDSTSAVDTLTDASIREHLTNELAGATKIIIAQRINSVAEADKIIVMDNGAIDAIGTHEELLQNNEIYKEVYHSQQKGVA